MAAPPPVKDASTRDNGGQCWRATEQRRRKGASKHRWRRDKEGQLTARMYTQLGLYSARTWIVLPGRGESIIIPLPT